MMQPGELRQRRPAPRQDQDGQHSDLMQGSNGAKEDTRTAQAHYGSALLQLLLIVGTFALVVRASHRMECIAYSIVYSVLV